MPKDTLWCEAKEFIPGQKYIPRIADESYRGVLCTGIVQKQDEHEALCPHAVEGQCQNGNNCPLKHGLLCITCGMYVLHPTDESQQKSHLKECNDNINLLMAADMEVAFQYAESNSKICGICNEKVSQKQPASKRRFGLLECDHAFCLDCIRYHRSLALPRATNRHGSLRHLRECPVESCGRYSDFVVPSVVWLKCGPEKKELICNYKKNCSSIPCRYYKPGRRPECPFGEYCFYKHGRANGESEK